MLIMVGYLVSMRMTLRVYAELLWFASHKQLQSHKVQMPHTQCWVPIVNPEVCMKQLKTTLIALFFMLALCLVFVSRVLVDLLRKNFPKKTQLKNRSLTQR